MAMYQLIPKGLIMEQRNAMMEVAWQIFQPTQPYSIDKKNKQSLTE